MTPAQVGHIKDIGHDPNLPTTRLYATHEAQPYHNDSSDIVGAPAPPLSRPHSSKSNPAQINHQVWERARVTKSCVGAGKAAQNKIDEYNIDCCALRLRRSLHKIIDYSLALSILH